MQLIRLSLLPGELQKAREATWVPLNSRVNEVGQESKMQPAPVRWVGSVPGSGHSGQGPPLPTGTGVMPGCAQLLGRRPIVCKELGEQPPSRSCENIGWASREIYPRMGGVPGPQAWPLRSHAGVESQGIVSPLHPGARRTALGWRDWPM